jgi:succinyl-diaminopimelate desuccinylase
LHVPRPPRPVDLTARLIRCPSVTPEEGGALQLLEAELAAAGFTCTRVDRAGVPNLYARWGEKGANRALGFNGHTDVVPVGDMESWTRDPFGGEIDGGRIWGRGACDMKSGVAAFVARRWISSAKPRRKGR